MKLIGNDTGMLKHVGVNIIQRDTVVIYIYIYIYTHVHWLVEIETIVRRNWFITCQPAVVLYSTY